MDSLRKEFDELAKEIDEKTSIESTLSNLAEQREMNVKEIIEYEKEMPALRIQVAELEKIAEALKNEFCPNNQQTKPA